MSSSKTNSSVRSVLIVTLIANLLVAAAKIVIGLIAQSLAIISDGIHSSMDATSNIIGLIGSAISERPPDESHPYGHQRFETLASMAIGGLLILTAWEIIKSSVERLIENITPTITALSFGVMIGTLAINIFIAIYERRAAKRLNSAILLADSEHTRSDIYVSLTVLASLVATRFGWGWIDAAAALVVVILIGQAAFKIIIRSVDVLVDHAALDANSVRHIIEEIPGIIDIPGVRSRGAANDIHLDIDLCVDAVMTADHGNSIAQEVRRKLRQSFDGLSEIRISFLPSHDTPQNYALQIRSEADALGLGAHSIIMLNGENGLILDMHVEVPAELTVGEAHEIVTTLEKRLSNTIAGLEKVVTHIEPMHMHDHIPVDVENKHQIADKALKVARKLYPDSNWHDLQIHAEADGGYAISLHCTVNSSLSLDKAHHLAEEVEAVIRTETPMIHRVTIHTEPEDNGDDEDS